MIIESVLNVIYNLFELLTSPIDLPNLPASVGDFMADALTYISMGAGILANYTHFSYLVTLLGLVLAVEVGIMLYNFVMYILHKIPFVNIK